MDRHAWIVTAVASVIALSIGYASAGDQEQAQQRVAAETQQQEQIYGSQLMTEPERAEYRAKMRAANTAEEREQIRIEHHERMKARAEERGVAIPPEPPMKGGGMGPSPGHGGGQP